MLKLFYLIHEEERKIIVCKQTNKVVCGVCGCCGKGYLGLMNTSAFSGKPEDIQPKIYFYCDECGSGHKLLAWEVGLLCDFTDFFQDLCDAVTIPE